MSFVNVFESIKATGGASFNLFSGQLNPTSGYMVGGVLEGMVCKIPETLDELRYEIRGLLNKSRFRNMNVSHLLLSETFFFGFWVHQNKLHIDFSELISDREEAIAKGKKRQQLCIWDNENKAEIDTRILMQLPNLPYESN